MSTPPTSSSGYTAVVHFPSPKAQPQQRDTALESLLQTATAHQGHQSSVVLRNASDTTSELILVLTFDNHDSWQRWESSSPAREAISQLNELTGTPGDGHLLNNMAGWFDLPGPAGLTTPPKWKSAVVSFVALVPLLYLIQFLLAPLTAGLSPDVAGILYAILMIGLATYFVLPFMTRILRHWLYPQPATTELITCAPTPGRPVTGTALRSIPTLQHLAEKA